MFTVEQIKAAHSKVKSGAAFPAYIQEIKQLGVSSYETWVRDGHTEYMGENNYCTASKPMYEPLIIADISDKEEFCRRLKMHQQGKTDYLTFCVDCAETGIEKWVVSLDGMTCIYYDNAGKEMLVEQIPS